MSRVVDSFKGYNKPDKCENCPFFSIIPDNVDDCYQELCLENDLPEGIERPEDALENMYDCCFVRYE